MEGIFPSPVLSVWRCYGVQKFTFVTHVRAWSTMRNGRTAVKEVSCNGDAASTDRSELHNVTVPFPFILKYNKN
jgi:hypothetical protein